MLDIGLLGSVVVIIGCLYAAARWAPVGSMPSNETVDRLYLPGLAALAVGRAVAAALDDRTSLGSLRAMLVLRGGVEFWPGVVAGAAVAAVGLRRAGRPVVVDLVELAPFALWGYGAWELTCWLRDGCFGPELPIGLVPDGLTHPQLPIGLFVGIAVVALGFVVRHDWSLGPHRRLLLALAGVAAARAVGSIWLPHLGGGLTRQHWESIAVAVAAAAALASAGWWAARARAVPLAEEHEPGESGDPTLTSSPIVRPHRVFRSGPAAVRPAQTEPTEQPPKS
jgi:hypothetical protein